MTTYIFVKIQPFRKWTILVLHNSSTINDKNTRFYNDSKRIVMRGVHSKSLIKGSRSRVSLNKIQKTDSKSGPPIYIWDQSNEVKRRSTYKYIIRFYHWWRNVPVEVPQGTKLGPSLFSLMIDDINTSNTELWKYVDDTTIAECVDKMEDSRIQSDVEELIAKSNQTSSS